MWMSVGHGVHKNVKIEGIPSVEPKIEPSTMYQTKKIVYLKEENGWVAILDHWIQLTGQYHELQLTIPMPDDLREMREACPMGYKHIDARFQIDASGDLFLTDAQAPRRVIRVPLDTRAVRWADQSDFDKMCCDNPDPRYPFDWNAVVWKAFLAHQSDSNSTVAAAISS